MKIAHKRRLRICGLVVISAGIIVIIETHLRTSLQHTGFFSGWLMLGLVVFLSLFNIRKKLDFLPLGSATNWTRWHVAMGFLVSFVFVLHIDFQLPSGLLETLLAILITTELLSGFLGLYICQTLPKTLNQRGEQVIFERISSYRVNLQNEMEQLIVRTLPETESLAISEFYSQRLLPFLQRPKHFWLHVFDSRSPYYHWNMEFTALQRYLNMREKEVLADIKELLVAKIDLDCQYASQAILKRWLFLHIPLSYGLLIFVLLHVILVYSTLGGF